jgi:CheY-like chemotaxis protein
MPSPASGRMPDATLNNQPDRRCTRLQSRLLSVNDKPGGIAHDGGIGNAGSDSTFMNRAASGLGKNILLVDDDPLARESIRLLLNIDRHIVTEAANGHEALLLFKAARYDLVITDYFMPGMLGDELAQSIRDIAPRQPILMITAYLEKLAAAGETAEAMLAKPLSVDELRRAMAKP